jgi:hypothetical protein
LHVPTGANGSVTLSNFSGLITGSSPNSLPEGASPRNWDCDYILGDVLTRPHLESVYSFGNSFSGPNPGSVAVNRTLNGQAWLSPGGILLDDSSPAYVGAAAANNISAGSDGLDVTGFAFDLPATSGVTGLSVTITGYSTAPVNIFVQLLFNGQPSGEVKTFRIYSNTSTFTFGGPTDGWQNALGPTGVNAASFGIRITAQSTYPLASALLTYATMMIYQTAESANFNFITSFTAANGALKNISLDANGNLWIEDATNTPGVLTLLDEGITPGSFGSSAETEDALYLAFSDLTTGSDVPRQYNAQGWIDRISQVGPGASPLFSATTTTGATPASITSWSITAGIATFQAANAFTAGEVITLSGFGTTTKFNGLVFNVLGAGLSGTQFEVSVQGITGSGTEAGVATPQYTYPIVASPNGITQLPQRVRPFAGILWSSAPGVLTAGTTITFYYSDSTNDVADAQLVNLFNSGRAVYVNITGAPVGNGTWQVTSVGIGTQPAEARQDFYFTITVPQTEAANYRGQSGYGLNYQITAATLTTVVPVPGLQVGQQFTAFGVGIANWDNLWTVTQALNASVMAINETTMVAGVATYSYALTGGSTAPPAAGELVTVTNTLNGGGIFNVIDVPIATVTGTNSGTFQVGGFPIADNFSAAIETGQASTAGTQFQFDPGQAVAGTQSSPIFGNSGGGVISLASSAGQVISPGTKQGVVFFITRNGYQTAPSPPVQFDVPTNSNYINITLIPVGPPNVIARGIALTESGQNGVPGGNFFTLPEAVQFTVNGVVFTSSALIINDNVTTSAKITFSDSVLLNGTAIDVQGNNLFNLIEIGSPAWLVKYASRMFFGGCQNKIQNLLNPTFDGGYIPGTNQQPLGWSTDPSYGLGGSLLNSPIFGNSYYIKNTGTGSAAALGMITQPVYQDAYQVPVLNINTLYSVRVTARAPGSSAAGNLIVDLTDSNIGTGYGATYGSFVIPLATLTTTFQTLTAPLLTFKFQTVPAGLVLRAWAQNLAASGDVEIDRIEIFDTSIPVLKTQVFASYVNAYESVDAVTGVLGVSSENEQPVNGGEVMDNILYLLKQKSWYEVQDTANTEPAYWDTARDVSQKAGAIGPNAHDQGEGWIVSACRPGLYVFIGGQPKKISQEIYQIWDAINWDAGKTVWVRNDVADRKLYVGVPLPTPNFWLPNAPVNANPTSPNVILYLNYQGVDDGQDLQQAVGLHATMFGNLMNPDGRRKWSIWNIASPYAEFVDTSDTDAELYLCNGIASSKVYTLEPNVRGVIPTDDGAPINSLYTTYGWNGDKVTQNPALGMHRKTWEYLTFLNSGAGLLNVRLLPEVLLGPDDPTAGYYPWTVAGGFQQSDPCMQDRETPLNFQCRRCFVEFSTSGYMDISEMTMVGKKNVWNQVRGTR